jgi:Tfp pilus assembly protein PilN
MIRINLLPHKKVKPVDKGVLRLWIAAVAIGVIVVLGIAGSYLLLSMEVSDLNAQKAAAESEMKSLNAKLKQVSDYEKKRKDYENKLAIIDQIEKMKIPLTPVLFEINRLVVKDIWVNKLVINDANFTINFKSTKKESIEPFYKTMQASKVFSNLSIDSTEAFSPKLSGSKDLPFTVKGTIAGYEEIKRPEAKAAARKPAQKAKPKPKK